MVLPAPFWPTMASDVPAGIARSKPESTGSPAGRVGERDVPEADLAGRHARSPGARPRTSAPAGSIAGSRRSTAATGAAAPSSAHESPPKAIMLVADGRAREGDERGERELAAGGGEAEGPEDGDVGGEHEQQAPDDRPLAQARRLASAARGGAAAWSGSARPSSRRARRGEAPSRRAGRPRAGRRTRRGAAPRAPRRSCGRARRRSRAAASASRARRRRATSGAHQA